MAIVKAFFRFLTKLKQSFIYAVVFIYWIVKIGLRPTSVLNAKSVGTYDNDDWTRFQNLGRFIAIWDDDGTEVYESIMDSPFKSPRHTRSDAHLDSFLENIPAQPNGARRVILQEMFDDELPENISTSMEHFPREFPDLADFTPDFSYLIMKRRNLHPLRWYQIETFNIVEKKAGVKGFHKDRHVLVDRYLLFRSNGNRLQGTSFTWQETTLYESFF